MARDVYGVHEVMIESNKHNRSFYNMSQKEFEDVFLCIEIDLEICRKTIK